MTGWDLVLTQWVLVDVPVAVVVHTVATLCRASLYSVIVVVAVAATGALGVEAISVAVVAAGVVVIVSSRVIIVGRCVVVVTATAATLEGLPVDEKLVGGALTFPAKNSHGDQATGKSGLNNRP